MLNIAESLVVTKPATYNYLHMGIFLTHIDLYQPPPNHLPNRLSVRRVSIDIYR